jgi:Co/Zn/Cd efflux system component
VNKTIFEITKMDCPSEENLIRMKLDGISGIVNLDFDIPNRNWPFFIIELTTGLISKSMGLVADSLDMLADSFVHGISFFAVGGTLIKKKRIAKLAGYFQITLTFVGFMEVLRRFFRAEELPDFSAMIIVSIFALIANGTCLYILQKVKEQRTGTYESKYDFYIE